MVKNKTKLFLDMDRVLCEFKIAASYADLFEKGYFEKLKPFEGVIDAIKDINDRQIADIYILSAYLAESPHALAEKHRWLERYLPFICRAHRIMIPCGTDKGKYISDTLGLDTDCILLDDYSPNLHSWAQRGRGIKLLNGVNGNHKTWQGERISLSEIRQLPELITSK